MSSVVSINPVAIKCFCIFLEVSPVGRACVAIGFCWAGLIVGAHDLVPMRAHELAPCLGAGVCPCHGDGVGLAAVWFGSPIGCRSTRPLIVGREIVVALFRLGRW